jgi:hypothetical protein
MSIEVTVITPRVFCLGSFIHHRGSLDVAVYAKYPDHIHYVYVRFPFEHKLPKDSPDHDKKKPRKTVKGFSKTSVQMKQQKAYWNREALRLTDKPLEAYRVALVCDTANNTIADRDRFMLANANMLARHNLATTQWVSPSGFCRDYIRDRANPTNATTKDSNL